MPNVRKCRNHQGDDCDKCAGTGYRKKCNRLCCIEYGCDGSGHCIPTPEEIEIHLRKEDRGHE